MGENRKELCKNLKSQKGIQEKNHCEIFLGLTYMDINEEITGGTPGRITTGISRGISEIFLELSDTFTTPRFICFYLEFFILSGFLSRWKILINLD